MEGFPDKRLTFQVRKVICGWVVVVPKIIVRDPVQFRLELLALRLDLTELT